MQTSVFYPFLPGSWTEQFKEPPCHKELHSFGFYISRYCCISSKHCGSLIDDTPVLQDMWKLIIAVQLEMLDDEIHKGHI